MIFLKEHFKIKIGVRRNLLHPLMLLVFIALRRIVQYLFKYYTDSMGPYLLPSLIFLSKFIFGLIAYLFLIYKSRSSNGIKYAGINLISSNYKIKQVDNTSRIVILVLLASYFDFVGTMTRKFFTYEGITSKTLENRVRSFQIIASGLLCYFTIRTKIYKHQIFSLIIISICLIIIILSELINNKGINEEKDENDPLLKIKFFIITFFSCFCRAYLDTIEKYLFEFNHLSPYKVIICEGFINFFLLLILFLINGCSLQLEKITNINIFVFIVLLLLYFFLSGLKNIYRVTTIKLYSPMTRALTECVLDPFISLIVFLVEYNIKDNFWIFFTINIICLFINAFFSLVYNDCIVLYCWGLEHETYLEIASRSSLINNEDDDSFDSNEEIELVEKN